MSEEIDLGDPRGLTDLGTFVGRARRLQPDGAVRLQSMGELLVMTVAVLTGSGLLGEGTVLGMRVLPIRPGAQIDATVSFASVTDRLARADASTTRFSVPPTTVSVPWAALTPPRDGWEPVGTVADGEVDRIAAQGISAVAEGTPEGAGGHAVESLRRRVWGAMSDTVPPIVGGLAFGAHALGFTQPGGSAAVAARGRWTRLSTRRGHVLAR